MKGRIGGSHPGGAVALWDNSAVHPPTDPGELERRVHRFLEDK
jgi:hypothetical protein